MIYMILRFKIATESGIRTVLSAYRSLFGGLAARHEQQQKECRVAFIYLKYQGYFNTFVHVRSKYQGYYFIISNELKIMSYIFNIK